MSVANDLLDAVAAAVTALGFTVPGSNPPVAVPVDKRKLPTAQETLDSVPQILVVPSLRPGSSTPWATAKSSGYPQALVEYNVGVAVVAAADGDPRANLPTYLSWKEQIAHRFLQAKPVNVSAVYTTRVIPEATIDPGAYSRLYDYLALALRFSCIEARG